ncbi:zinc-ribbon and DUF3426 domain-containing protein [Caldimonas thermodepolymerans]|jgi:U5 snRNP spliceosome subunit|uniref:zinc-ribbon and DUF3426 domain-containing protein n=1 Tax=Caldimonas thermodepolymerans TaxID=215580 RepID=UPI00249362A1|nr:zinc-ribbon and DUF3426 domain-containing protein [Caldimonas thermodepolymerans]
MSLATRCPACHTTFRVVQDQLKVSEGWVRCGRCNEVFNAIEGLFDLERDGMPPPAPAPRAAQAPARQVPPPPPPPAPAPAVPPPPTPQAAAGAPAAAAATVEEDEADEVTTAYDVLDSRFLSRSTYGAHEAPEKDEDDGFADARFDSTLEEHELESQAVAAGLGAAPPSAGGEAARRKSRLRGTPVRERRSSADDDEVAPEFLRKAERAERWRRPWVRAVLGLVALLLLGALLLQVAHHQRDRLAATYPATRPWLERLCDVARCTVGPWQHIEAIVIGGSSLSAGAATDSYRLSVLVRNDGNVPVAVPHIELRLADYNGELITRRALSPADFRHRQVVIAPRSEVSLDLEFTSPGRRVASFTVSAFYP